MKLILLLVLFVTTAVAKPADVVFSVFGSWPLCALNSIFCVAAGEETYMLQIKASDDAVTGFVYTIFYTLNGNSMVTSGYLQRDDTVFGYSNTAPMVLGQRVEVTVIDVTEIF